MHLGHKVVDFRKRLWTKKQETKKSLCPSRQGTEATNRGLSIGSIEVDSFQFVGIKVVESFRFVEIKEISLHQSTTQSRSIMTPLYG